ncbi:hypothetical protein E2C01_101788 [Portunus trituberculatus]|uniref:Uncharacterized protein n=1 Tax=Portunus trituberculatus TaxID=210409 RepID=A0A5B7KAP6_PORTR|nr:hypothetical protein [Portunus trituberculatus]
MHYSNLASDDVDEYLLYPTRHEEEEEEEEEEEGECCRSPTKMKCRKVFRVCVCVCVCVCVIMHAGQERPRRGILIMVSGGREGEEGEEGKEEEGVMNLLSLYPHSRLWIKAAPD